MIGRRAPDPPVDGGGPAAAKASGWVRARHALLAAAVIAAVVVTVDPDPFPALHGVFARTQPVETTSPGSATTTPPGGSRSSSSTTPASSPAPDAVAPSPTEPIPEPATTAPIAATSSPDVGTPNPQPAPLSEASVPPSTVARALGQVLPVFASPTDRAPLFALRSTTEWGNPRVLLTTQRGGDWIQVLLPVRPNNSVGWVRARDVVLSEVADSIAVDLEARTLTWARGGAVVLQVPVAIGAPATPTPTGDFFVTDLVPEDPAGPYGAWAIALNSYSEALTTFEGGDPRIAIHGTNAPSSIGRAASNGCVRLPTDPLAALAAAIPQGTPVTIR